MSANKMSNIIDDINNMIHSNKEEISKNLLNIYGYPNNIYLECQPNVTEWVLNGVVIAKLEIVWNNNEICIETNYPNENLKTSHP